MPNTASLGNIWKPTAWRDGEPVPRVALPDGTLAEAMASLGYGWDTTNSVWRKILVDTSGNQIVSTTGTTTVSGTVSVSQGTFDEILQEMKKQTLQLGLLLAQFSGVNDFDAEGLTS